MRAVAAFAGAATLLAGCATGPAPTDVRAALDDRRHPADAERVAPGWPADDASLVGARLDTVGRCGSTGKFFTCEGTFVLRDGSVREVNLWLLRFDGTWRLMDIVPKDAEL